MVETELPDTLATLRLSGLELSDCLAEMNGLGTDLSSGVRASAKMVAAAEQVMSGGRQARPTALGIQGGVRLRLLMVSIGLRSQQRLGVFGG